MGQESKGSSEDSTQDEPSTVVQRCCSVSVPLLVLLVLVAIVLFLVFIYVSDLAHLFEADNTTTAASEDDSYKYCARHWGIEVPTEAMHGTETHTGPLPGDVQPLHYTITMTLCGTSLEDAALKVTGRVEVLFKAKAAASKLVLKAHPEWIKRIKVALSGTSGPACARPQGRNIDSVTLSAPFVIVKLQEPLSVGTPYSLAADYDYERTVPSGPIVLSPPFVYMYRKDKADLKEHVQEPSGQNVKKKLQGHSCDCCQDPHKCYICAGAERDRLRAQVYNYPTDCHGQSGVGCVPF